MLGLALAFGSWSGPGALLAAAAALGLGLALMRPAPVRRLAELGFRLGGGRWPRLFGRLRAGARAMAPLSRPATGAGLLLLGLAGWAAEATAFWLLLGWLGAPLPLATAAGIFALATLGGGASGMPGGLGGAEAAMLGLLALAGVPAAPALAATAIIRLTTLWFAVGLGALFLAPAEASAARAGAGGRDVPHP
ncbi:MAG: hypothetical protein D6832_01360 [Alphaproteobacteria bacterium]|nr:MAG: hypothetical protein D6832_01360 [Alphaproteobacteria bacterium]